MSIKSLFENIADAIKDKNPNIANVTPVEMPSAIRSIPSGSSTAGGVTYDNTASGLNANNVQDAIDELSEDVSTINSDLSELKPGYVEVTCDGVKTYKQIFNDLYALVDRTKLRNSSKIRNTTSSQTETSVFNLMILRENIVFGIASISGPAIAFVQIALDQSSSRYQHYKTGQSSITDYTDAVSTSGEKFRLEY